MLFSEYIRAELLILIPVIYVCGTILKKSSLPDKKIPICLGILSVLMCGIWVISVSDITDIKQFAAALFTAITQGILIAGASVYANQILRQGKKNE